MTSRPARTLRGDRAATTTLEFGLIAPVFLMLVLGILVYGRFIWLAHAMQMAGQQTARCVAIGSNLCPSPADYAVTLASRYGVVGLTTSGVAVDNSATATTNAAACNPPGGNTFVRVTITLVFMDAAASFLPNIAAQPIVTVACYPVTGS